MTMTIRPPSPVAEDLGRRLAARAVNYPGEPQQPAEWPTLTNEQRVAVRNALRHYLVAVAQHPGVEIHETRARRARAVLRLVQS